MNGGGGMSFNDYLDGASRQVVELAAGLVRKKTPGVQVGLVTEPQWATVKENEDGQNVVTPLANNLSGSIY